MAQGGDDDGKQRERRATDGEHAHQQLGVDEEGHAPRSDDKAGANGAAGDAAARRMAREGDDEKQELIDRAKAGKPVSAFRPLPEEAVAAQNSKDRQIPASRLKKITPEERSAFKHRVYEEQIREARARGDHFFAGVLPEELAPVEDHHKLRKDAAADCKALLHQARADLTKARAANDPLALKTTRIGLASSYRDPPTDFGKWDEYFEQYYNQTKPEREKFEDPHGEQALRVMVKHYQKSKAAPGFSNHTKGIAVDFKANIKDEHGGEIEIGASHAHDKYWKDCWLRHWLVENAARFGFEPLATEYWHFDHKGVKGGWPEDSGGSACLG